jgi:hypothetical protein
VVSLTCAYCDLPAFVTGRKGKYPGPPVCRAHYERRRRGMDMTAPIRRAYERHDCAYCGRRAVAHAPTGEALCNAHYIRFRRGMDLDAPMTRRVRNDRAASLLERAALALADAESERAYRTARDRLLVYARRYVTDARVAA